MQLTLQRNSVQAMVSAGLGGFRRLERQLLPTQQWQQLALLMRSCRGLLLPIVPRPAGCRRYQLHCLPPPQRLAAYLLLLGSRKLPMLVLRAQPVLVDWPPLAQHLQLPRTTPQRVHCSPATERQYSARLQCLHSHQHHGAPAPQRVHCTAAAAQPRARLTASCSAAYTTTCCAAWWPMPPPLLPTSVCKRPCKTWQRGTASHIHGLN